MQTQIQIEKLHRELEELRDRGVNRTLREHLQIEYPDYGSSSYSVDENYSFEKYIHEFLTEHSTEIGGIRNVGAIRVSQFYGLDRSWVRLFSELILSVITDGYRSHIDVDELLTVSVDTTQNTITLPVIDTKPLSRMLGPTEAVELGVEFSKDQVKVGQKTVSVNKFGKQMDFPYETVDDLPFDIIGVYLRQRGVALAIDELLYFIDIIVNGDRGIDKNNKVIEDTIAVIGVNDTGKGIQYRDILRAAIRMTMLGFPAPNILAEETQVTDIACLEEFWKRMQGTPLAALEIKGGIRIPDKIWPIITGVGDNAAIIQSDIGGTGRFTRQGLKIEYDKVITKQLHEMVVSLRVGYMNFFRNARVKIDGTKTFASTPWPEYFEPLVPAKKGK